MSSSTTRSTGPDALALSPMQKGMLADSLLREGRGINVEQIVCEMQEPLDLERFRTAWQHASDRFDALRLKFSWPEEGEPSQLPQPSVDVPFRVVDWAARPPEEREAGLAAFLEQDRQAGFDLFSAPLMRVTVCDFGGGAWSCVWTVHHTIIDGQSYAIVLEHVFSVYEDLLHNATQSYEAPPRYETFLRWISGCDSTAGREYFRKLLRGFAEPTSLPLHRAGARSPTKRTGEACHRFGLQTTERLRRFAEASGATLNTIVQLAWSILLGRYTDRDDVVFGATWAGRRDTIAGADRIVGVFINTLPVRLRVGQTTTVREAIQAIRQQHVEVRRLQHTPLTEIKAVSEITGRARLFETIVVFDYQRFDAVLQETNDAWQKRKLWSRSQTGYPLVLWGDLDRGALEVHLDYDIGLYGGEKAEEMLCGYGKLLRGLATDAERRVHDLEIVSEGAYVELTKTEAAREQDPPMRPVVRRILEKADAFPGARAIETMEGAGLTYGALAQRVRTLAVELQARGVCQNDLVAVLLPRSVEAIVSMLAVHLAGGAFLPVDPGYPVKRIELMLEDSHAQLVLVNGDTRSRLPRDRYGVLDVESVAEVPTGPTIADIGPWSPAYVIYTSGSTGTPKGVCIPQGALANHTEATIESQRLAEKDRVLQFAALSFDVCIEEIFPTLAAGATLVLRNDDMAVSAECFFECVERFRLTVLNLPTAFWHHLVRSDPTREWPSTLRLLVVGGEQAAPEVHAEFRKASTAHIRWLNAYGPTEATITSTWYDDAEGDHDTTLMPIGRPVRGVSHFVLDSHMRPLPPGAAGQLFIGGAGLALGYLGRDDSTDERFVPHPWRDGAKLFATRDLVRRTSKGNYVYIGRLDDQLKIRGFRIEPGEIEARLLGCQGVREAAIIVQERQPSDSTLVGYVVGEAVGLSSDSLREYLADVLPGYMVPEVVVRHSSLPRNPAGKIDRHALAAEGAAGVPRDRPPASGVQVEALELRLMHVWSEILHVPVTNASADFFELGGHSLLAVQLFAEIERRFGRTCDPQAFFREPTIARLAGLMHEGCEADWTAPLVCLKEGESGTRPLFLSHGVTGRALDYVHLAAALNPVVPVWGLQARGLREGERPHRDLEEGARYYVDLIRSVQPSGPYAVGGFSAGGTISLAIAEALHELGEETDFIGVFDAEPPASVPIPSPFTSPKRLIRVGRTTVGRIVEVLERPAALSVLWGRTRSAMARAASRWFPRVWRHDYTVVELLQGEDLGLSSDDIELMQSFLDAVMRYEPKNYPLDVTLFRTVLDPFEGPHEPDLAWNRVVTGTVTVEELPGRHHEVLADKGAEHLARSLERHLLGRPTRGSGSPASRGAP